MNANNEEIMILLDRIERKVMDLSVQLRSVGQDIPKEIDSYHYLTDTLSPSRRIEPAGGWAAPYTTIARLTQLILDDQVQTNKIVELGGGVSTIWLGYAARANGRSKIFSVEHDLRYYDKVKSLVTQHNLDKWIDLVHSPISEYPDSENSEKWYSLSEEEWYMSGVDMLIVDGPPGATSTNARYPAYPFFRPFLRDGALVLLDDVDRNVEWEIGINWTKLQSELGSLSLFERLGRSTLFKFERKKG